MCFLGWGSLVAVEGNATQDLAWGSELSRPLFDHHVCFFFFLLRGYKYTLDLILEIITGTFWRKLLDLIYDVCCGCLQDVAH